MRLTAAEVSELCEGITQPAAQIRFLRSIGIRAERSRLGTVIVLREWLTQDCRQGEHEEPVLNL